MINWSYCNKPVPEHEDLVYLADCINYAKRRMWASLNEPYNNSYDSDWSEEAMEFYMIKIEKLTAEYFYMVKNFFGERCV